MALNRICVRLSLAYHEGLELLVDPTVVPDPVTIGGALVDEELVGGGMMTITVDTPEVIVESADAGEFELVV